jgi:hypothetical protein
MASALLVVVHVLTVFWLIAGIAGRDYCYRQAGRASELAELRTLASMGELFDAMARPASFFVLITGLTTASFQGWPILGLLQGGSYNWVLASLVLYLGVVPLIAFVFVPKGRIYRATLARAVERSEVTPAIKAALRDPVVAAARTYEIVMSVVLAFLMIAKPF